MPPAPHARLAALFLAGYPRASIRVDTPDGRGGWRHAYREVPCPVVPPPQPWLIYLAGNDGRFRWLCFDLDAKAGGEAVVERDLEVLGGWLDRVGLSFVVAASGPGAGRHVWVRAAEPLVPELVRAIAEEASARLRTLDHGMLCNPATGGARPLGAPHRFGGHSRLLFPEEEDRAAELLTAEGCGNGPGRFTALLTAISAVPVLEGGRGAASRALRGRRPVREVLQDADGAPYLAGAARTVLDEETAALLYRRPPADEVSEVQGRLLVRLAVRSWRLPMVERLLSDRRARAGGLLHAVTRVTAAGRRELTERQARAKLRREWERCVQFASRLPALPEQSVPWSARVAEVTAVVASVQAAADAWPERWASEAGPADRAALDLVCLLALEAGTLDLALDVRRAGLATGFGSSTMHRALGRLLMDGWLGEGPPDGGPAAVYRLLPAGPSALAADDPDEASARGGTQENSPPGGGLEKVRLGLLDRLGERLAVGAEDAFSFGRPGLGRAGGLGHHAGRIYQQIREADGPVTLSDLVERCGYAARTVGHHLRRMADLMILSSVVHTVHHRCGDCGAAPGAPCSGTVRRGRVLQHRGRRRTAAAAALRGRLFRPRAGALVTAARILGAHGRAATRARLYERQQERWRWLRDGAQGLRLAA